MKRIVTVSLMMMVLVISKGFSQCIVAAHADPVEICAGQSVNLWAVGGCGLLMYNNFNDGTPGSGWVATTGVNFTNPCGPGPDLIHLWMGNQVPIPRTLTTVPFDVSELCHISFWMRFEVQHGNPGGNCEGPDLADEGMSLQYSVNGGTTWTDIVYFRPDGVELPSYPNSSGFISVGNGQQTAFTTWAQYTYPVPVAAASPATLFRWRQHVYTSQDYDHWGLDLVEIVCPGSSEVVWSHGPTVLDPPDVTPTQTTTYVVTVYDTINNLSATDSVTVIVNPGPTAQFSATTVCQGDETIFTDQSTPMSYPLNSWTWDFDDGNTSTNQNPQHTYGSYGTYNVTLQIQDEYGCGDQVTQQVEVHAAPEIQFSAQPVEGCAPLLVSFQNQTTVPGGTSVASNLWDFGNGATSVANSPSVTYSTEGTYSVTLTSATAAGCESTLTMDDYITVYPNPIASFSYSPDENFMLDPVFFHDLSIGASQWQWTFGDGNSSEQQNPNHTYGNSGSYNVTLYVENSYGCYDEITLPVLVQSSDMIYFPNAFTPNGDGINDHFMPHGVFWSSEGYQMRIYNRYGDEIFYTSEMNRPWDGRHQRTGEIVPAGVYTWVIVIRTLNDKEHLYRGFVTVVH
jgi:gliding motility-associated-like protein